MTDQYILAIDLGTTGTTVLIIDQAGRVVSRAGSEFTQIYPQPGWVEHDPEEIWSVSIDAVQAALQQAGLTANNIKGIGITNQRETTVVWDKTTGRAVYNAIVWQCRRTASACEAMKADGLEPIVRENTGLVIDAYFSATKLAWILDHIPNGHSRAEAGELLFGTIDSWLVWKLTGGKAHLTDYTNASRTMLYNLRDLCWDQQLLDYFHIPVHMLPQVKSCSEIYACTSAELLGAEIPICGIAGDQQAALFGQTAFEPGDAKNTYGTGCFLLMNTGRTAIKSTHGLLTTIAWGLDSQICYALEGSVFIAGAAIQWLRDELGIINSAAESETLALSITDNEGVYLVPAFVGLGAPHWDMYARGVLTGLTRGSGKAHLARAALESIAYQSCDVLAAMTADAGVAINSLKVDGGATANRFLMQFQADVLDVCVEKPLITETTALGAAFLAGLACGFWSSQEELKNIRSVEQHFIPSMPAKERMRLRQGWQEAVSRTLSR